MDMVKITTVVQFFVLDHEESNEGQDSITWYKRTIQSKSCTYQLEAEKLNKYRA